MQVDNHSPKHPKNISIIIIIIIHAEGEEVGEEPDDKQGLGNGVDPGTYAAVLRY
jgi:hypothetical protein